MRMSCQMPRFFPSDGCTIASTHFAYPWREGQAEFVDSAGYKKYTYLLIYDNKNDDVIIIFSLTS